MAGPSFSLDDHEAVGKALQGLSKKEISKLLFEAGRRMVQQHKIFRQHWNKGQSAWNPPSVASGNWVKNKFGGTGKFSKTGAAQKLLDKKPKKSGDGLIMTVSRKYMNLTIHLRRMVDGKNVYAIAQAGRFKGVTKRDGSKVSAEDVRKENAAAYREYSSARERGSKVSLREVASKRAKARGLDGATRNSDNPRPITQVQEQDIPLIQKALLDEIQITLKLKGLL